MIKKTVQLNLGTGRTKCAVREIRLLSLVISATISSVARDPRRASAKVSELIAPRLPRLVRNPLLRFSESFQNSASRIPKIGAFLEEKWVQEKLEAAERTSLASDLGGVHDNPRFGNRGEGTRGYHDGDRVLMIVNNSLPWKRSGYTQRTHAIVQELELKGIEVVVVARMGFPITQFDRPGSDIVEVDGVTYRLNLPWRMRPNLRRRLEQEIARLARLGEERGVTHVHATTPCDTGFIGMEVAHQLGVPFTFEARGELDLTWSAGKTLEKPLSSAEAAFVAQWREMESKVARTADRVVVLSKVSADIWASRGISPQRIVIQRNFLRPEELERAQQWCMEFPTGPARRKEKERIRSELGLAEELVRSYLVGCITSVVHYEGIEIAVKAVAQLVDGGGITEGLPGNENYPEECHLLIVGDGPSLGSVEAELERQALQRHIHVLGRKPQREIHQWYAALDCFVVPRLDLPVCRTVTPIKALMAQAYEIPVICSDLPALREITENKAEYVRAGDVAMLSMAISRLRESRRWR